ncbi:hypothetical protein GCM10027093_43840 [Paraburkholderia jirisanensis]
MAKLEQIQARIKKLQEQAEALVTRRAQGALDQIRELMLKHGLTTHDIETRAKARRDRAQAKRLGLDGKATSASASKGKLPPKYRDPKTGATWSGHARPPAWIKDVKDRSKFLIDGGSAAGGAQAAASAKTAGRKTAAKKAAAKKATAKGAAARKTGAAKSAVKTAAKSAVKTAAKKAGVKGAAAKKTAARKTAAKKTAAKRAAPGAAKKAVAKKGAAKKTAVKKAAAKKTAAHGSSGVVKHVVVKHAGPTRKASPSSSHVAGPDRVNGAITLS